MRQTAVREDIDATVVTQTRESVRNVPENPTTRITSLTVDSATVVNTLRVPRTRVMLVTIVICVVLNRTRLILVRSVRVRSARIHTLQHALRCAENHILSLIAYSFVTKPLEHESTRTPTPSPTTTTYRYVYAM